MGSGLGAGHSYSGDYDLMTADSEAVKENGLQNLRFGDIVLIEDSDNTFGRGYLKGITHGWYRDPRRLYRPRPWTGDYDGSRDEEAHHSRCVGQ